jgi:hypothetical protein
MSDLEVQAEKKRKQESISKQTTALPSAIDGLKFFSFRFEQVFDRSDNDPCEMDLVQKYIVVKDLGINVKSVSFWGAYLRKLVRLGVLDTCIECINLLPWRSSEKDAAVLAEIVSVADKESVLSAELLADCSDEFLVFLFTTPHGWGEQNFVAGGQIKQIEFDVAEDQFDVAEDPTATNLQD